MLREERGITLVALIITVIILVILAAVTIITMQNSNMIKYALEGTQKYQNAQIDEENTINTFENTISTTLQNISTIESEYQSTLKWKKDTATPTPTPGE